MPTVAALRALAAQHGLAALGVAPADPFETTLAILEQRKADGFHGGMQFTYRNPARSTDPGRTLPGARSLVVAALGYRHADPDPPAPSTPTGIVARYARADHYARLRAGLDAIADHLRAHGHQARVLVDDNALVDREAAVRAGLGWYGKSANVLIADRGSWFVLGTVVTDAELPPSESVADGCGPCTRCIDGCPTGAIVAPGVVDARRCLAWLVQAEGSFPMAQRAALGARIYGCDDCQEVCPPNKLDERREPPPPTGDDDQAWVGLIELLRSTDEELLARHGRWYIPRRDPRYLRRNALVALGNVGDRRDPAVVAVLDEARASDDALLREHAGWAADRLGIV